jgi:hypothetical protein
VAAAAAAKVEFQLRPQAVVVEVDRCSTQNLRWLQEPLTQSQSAAVALAVLVVH